jgi:hypothetical protein
MKDIELISKEFFIVLLGDFNPPIYHPSWFYDKKMLSRTEFEQAIEKKEFLMTGDISQFVTSYFMLQVTRDRIMIKSEQEVYFHKIIEILLQTLETLPETPIKAIGINKSHKYHFNNEQQWHNVGHKIAPKDTIWNKVFKKPGLAFIKIIPERDDDFEGHIEFHSDSHEKCKINFFLNDHINIHKKENISFAEQVKEILTLCQSNEKNLVLKNHAMLSKRF